MLREAGTRNTLGAQDSALDSPLVKTSLTRKLSHWSNGSTRLVHVLNEVSVERLKVTTKH